MASQSITRVDVFPEGTTVGAYRRSGWSQAVLPPSGAPPGSAVATGVMTNGVASLQGLLPDTDYFAAAQVSGTWRYVAFHTADATTSAAPLLVVDAALGDGVQDATAGIQAALDAALAAGGGHVYVPAGTYLLTSASPGYLQIGSNTTLELDPQATIKRNNTGNGMLRPYGTTNDTASPAVYAGASNVEVSGGTWDGNKANFAQAHNILTFTHADNVRVHDTTLKNCFGFHFLEFNSTRNGRATNVTFLDFDSSTSAKEMLQIDNAVTPVLGGAADSTPCQDIVIEGCHFRNGARGIGTHTSATHRNIKVKGCHFDTMREEAIRAQDWFDSVIEGNTFINCGATAVVNVLSTASTVRGVVIRGNTINLVSASSNCRGISIDGQDTNYRARECVVADNTVLGTGAGTGSWGIQLRFAQECVVSGNHVSGWPQSGIMVFKSTVITVTGNSAHRNNTAAAATHADITTTGSTATDLQDVLLTGNTCDTMLLGSFGDRISVTGNIVRTTYTLTATSPPTNVNKVANFLAGVWTA